METLNSISEILISSYLISSILNLFFSKSVFKIDFKFIQNKIGIVLLFGLLLYYGIFGLRLLIAWYSGDSLEDFRLTRFYTEPENYGYNLILISPLIAFIFNLTRKLRTKKYVILFTSLIFFPRIMSFLIVYLSSDVTLATINRVYLNPLLMVMIAGPLLYFILISIEKAQEKIKTHANNI